MLSTIERDYWLKLKGATLDGEPVWVIEGTLRQERREEILDSSQRETWPALCPTRVRVAVKSNPDPETGFGKLLPIRMEYWSDPSRSDAPSVKQKSERLITLIELYSIRPISPPPPQRFRFENRDAEVTFANETDRYIQMYGIHLTDGQRRRLRR